MTNITIEIQNAINKDFETNFTNSISNRDKWIKVYHILTIFSHLLIGATIILSFIGGGIHVPSLSLLAGALGVGSQASNQYAQFAYSQYKEQSSLIETMSKTVKANDILNDEPDEESSPAQPTPVNTPQNN